MEALSSWAVHMCVGCVCVCVCVCACVCCVFHEFCLILSSLLLVHVYSPFSAVTLYLWVDRWPRANLFQLYAGSCSNGRQGCCRMINYKQHHFITCRQCLLFSPLPWKLIYTARHWCSLLSSHITGFIKRAIEEWGRDNVQTEGEFIICLRLLLYCLSTLTHLIIPLKKTGI